MQRIITEPRNDWSKKVEEVGFVFHTTDQSQSYWDESCYYKFNAKQIDDIEEATNNLHKLCLEAVDYVIKNNLFSILKIPQIAIPLIKKSWERKEKSLYGRFDLAYDGINHPKLLEYNADTPTSLLEAAVVQWFWLQDKFKSADQFNSIHERLIARWQELAKNINKPIHFSHVENVEDLITVNYLRDIAMQASIPTEILLMNEIGWDGLKRHFVDLKDDRIDGIFKLYPWEWMLEEEYGQFVPESFDGMNWIEPIWKMILANKGILSILWELNPGHPNLLKAYFGEPRNMKNYVKKPLLSREGANIFIIKDGYKIENGGDYGKEGFIYQELIEIKNFDGNYPVIGSWVIGDESAGMGIREAKSLITDDTSRFIPHIFE